MKEMYFEFEFKIEDFYWGNGFLKLRNDEFEGYIAYDFISGIYQNGTFTVNLLEYDFLEQIPYLSSFFGIVSNFELPDIFYLTSEENIYAKLEVTKVADVNIISFEKELNKIKNLYV